MDKVTFTAHNIRLDDGSMTKPDIGITMDQQRIFLAARRLIHLVFPTFKTSPSSQPPKLVDLGCLEGGFSVEFARMGLHVTGIEVRDSNIAACNYVKNKTNLPNLQFFKDNAWNVGRYGPFDIVFCVGLLYHFDTPRKMLKLLSDNTRNLLFVDTHFSSETSTELHGLSGITENEGLRGRWYMEFSNDQDYEKRDEFRWASWENRRSFWPLRHHLIQAIKDVGFDLVLEQYDHMAPDIVADMEQGFYFQQNRNSFIGIKL
jgi:Methyltransferase domain